MWAIGIITYLLLAGQHPICSSNETKESYCAKMANPQFAIPGHFTQYHFVSS